ncbi:uncharacterized protein LOC127874791 [Dreissena polymorpha]|uniref:Uncharacterized protein n=1 Tax=Dreissena polymorpha TaxID=45954 RepID=A0A9D4L4G4_DREPO|nr:uncharacterized protein LOC127874791 [Dreissena polymorpha]KAH3851603.1 hypothetical protein DPMN_094085 [Dreissena polymorpha]
MGKRKSDDVADVGMRRPQKTQVRQQQVGSADHSVDTVDTGSKLQDKTIHNINVNAATTRQEGSKEKTIVPEESDDNAHAEIAHLKEELKVGIASTSTPADKDSPVKKRRSTGIAGRLRKLIGKKTDQGKS